MTQKNLAVYTNDHLAGSRAALGLFDRARAQVDDREAVRVLTRVCQAVRADKETLRHLMHQLDVSESLLRKVGAVVAQKLSNLKFRFQGTRHGELQLLHVLDTLALGIEGKKALWTALAAAADEDPRLRLEDYDHLLERANGQIASLRDLRLQVARRALAPGPRPEPRDLASEGVGAAPSA